MVLMPDIIATLRFYPQDQGGRSMPIPAEFKFFPCMTKIGNSYHDARLFLEETGAIYPGDEKKHVPIKFLCADLVIPKIRCGDKFFIREGRIVAEGIVEKIINTNPASTA